MKNSQPKRIVLFFATVVFLAGGANAGIVKPLKASKVVFPKKDCQCNLSGIQGIAVGLPGRIIEANQPSVTVKPKGIDSTKKKPVPAYVSSSLPTGYFLAQVVPGEIALDVRLKGCPCLQNAIQWRDSAGHMFFYDQWNGFMKARLNHFFQRLLKNAANLGAVKPDFSQALFQNRRLYLTREEAFDLFAVKVAHTLYLEATGKVPWKVACSSDLELQQLFSSDAVCTPIKVSVSANTYPSHIVAGRDYQLPVPHATAPMAIHDPRIGFNYLMGNHVHNSSKLVDTTMQSTLAKLSMHMRQYWGHGGGFGTDTAIDWTKEVLLSDKIVPEGTHLNKAYSGCHEFSSVLVGLAHCINLPVMIVSTLEYKNETGGHFTNRSHGGAVFRPGTSQARILWHGDELYAMEPGPLFAADAGGNALTGTAMESLLFERLWPTVATVQNWGFHYALQKVIPGVGFGQSDRGNYEDYYDFGWMGGYWELSDRAAALYATETPSSPNWATFKAYSNDLLKHFQLENYYQLAIWKLVDWSCDAQYGSLYINDFVTNMRGGIRSGNPPPVQHTANDFIARLNACKNAHGGCGAVQQAKQNWDALRQ